MTGSGAFKLTVKNVSRLPNSCMPQGDRVAQDRQKEVLMQQSGLLSKEQDTSTPSFSVLDVGPRLQQTQRKSHGGKTPAFSISSDLGFTATDGVFVARAGGLPQIRQVGFKHEGDQMKKLNATAHAASMFMQLRRDSIKQDPVCPRCSPHLCSSACDWAKEEGRVQVELPFLPRPSKLRPKVLFTLMCLAFLVGVFAILYFGTNVLSSPKRRPPSMLGCGGRPPDDDDEPAVVNLVFSGLTLQELTEPTVCAQIRTSITEILGMEAGRVSLFKSREKTSHCHICPPAVETVLAITSTASAQLGASTRRKGGWGDETRDAEEEEDAEEAEDAQDAAGGHVLSTPKRHVGKHKLGLGVVRGGQGAVYARSQRSALEELVASLQAVIVSGELDRKLEKDWGLNVKSEFGGVASLADMIVQGLASPSAGGGEAGATLICPPFSSAPEGAVWQGACRCRDGYTGNSKSCVECPSGFYCPPGENSKHQCNPNSVSPARATMHTQCECTAGFYGVAGGLCTACEFNHYCPGKGEHLECPPHSIEATDSTRTRVEDCECEAGFYRPGRDAGDSLSQTQPNASNDACLECPAGHACPGGARAPAVCPAGWYAVGGSSACLLCAPGFSSAPAAHACQNLTCPKDAVPIAEKVAAIRNGMIQGRPITGQDVCKCIGTGNNKYYMFDTILPEPWPANPWPAQTPWVACGDCADKQCAPGSFNLGCGHPSQNFAGSKNPGGFCIKCAIGTYAEADPDCDYKCSGRGREQCEQCGVIRCSAGMFLLGCGGNSSGTCTDCPPLTYSEGEGVGRTQCKQCGIVNEQDSIIARCGVGQILQGCGLGSSGTCVTCPADAFSSSDGTLAKLEYACTRCDSLQCAPGTYLHGCGTVLDQDSKPTRSEQGFCFPCPSGTYTPTGGGFRYDTCASCPVDKCPGSAGEVYLHGCVGTSTGECRNMSCLSVDTRTLCSVLIQPKVASSMRIAGNQGIRSFAPSDTDAFGSAVAWLSPLQHNGTSAWNVSHHVLAVGAPKQALGNGAWRRGGVYLLRIMKTAMAPAPPATPVVIVGDKEASLLLHIDLSACGTGLEAHNGDEFGLALASIGDLDGDGLPELAISSPYRVSPILKLPDAGMVCILFFKLVEGEVGGQEIQVKSFSVITLETMGEGQTEAITKLQQPASYFGCALTALGDVNGDGVPDMAVSACGVDDKAGAVVVLLMSQAGHVIGSHTISKGSAGTSSLYTVARALASRAQGGGGGGGQDSSATEIEELGFGLALAAVGDIDYDGFSEIAVVVSGYSALVMVRLGAGGVIKFVTPVTFDNGTVVQLQQHTNSISTLGDITGDMVPDLVVGGGGSLSILSLQGQGSRSVEINKSPDTDKSNQTTLSEIRVLDTSADLLFRGLELEAGTHTFILTHIQTNMQIQIIRSVSSNSARMSYKIAAGTYLGIAISTVNDINGDYALDLAVGAMGLGGNALQVVAVTTHGCTLSDDDFGPHQTLHVQPCHNMQ